MEFKADLHVHSKFSIATAKNLDLENLYIAAQLKGITVVGTGDVTHPAWFSEIKNKLVQTESGLFKLKNDIAAECDKKVPKSCRGIVRFILVSEISNIYKKNSRTRKNHNLVFLPDTAAASIFNSRLDSIGNIKSDGRPILGLDARDLLEILLETTEKGFLIPAHIWTPWFSVLGSQSGFDSIKECFEDLTPHIFAVETGLSSDPAMNWRVSNLDELTLVSNSDAHSPSKLGRESNLFNTELDYLSIKSALATGDSETFRGTLEFYPEEGKYHLDGHRKCGVRLFPKDSAEYKKICPVCGKPLTLGVLYRVEELSDRRVGEMPEKTHPYYSLVSLAGIISEIVQTGPNSKKVQKVYQKAIETLGPELDILHSLTIEEIDCAGIPLLGEAVKRMRNKEIEIFPGFDGEFGTIRIFKENEQDALLGQKPLFSIDEQVEKTKCRKNKKSIKKKKLQEKEKRGKDTVKTKSSEIKALNPLQKKAVEIDDGPLLIVAGPGTGKTLTITHKIAHIINNKKISPDNIIALTFTNKAAGEMRERLKTLLEDKDKIPMAATFHALCFKILKDLKNKSRYSLIDERDRQYMVYEALKLAGIETENVSVSLPAFLDMIITAKQNILEPVDNLETIAAKYRCEHELFKTVYETYQDLLSTQGLYDYEDLIFKVVKLLEKGKNIRKKYQELFKYVFIDEYQDLNHGQYRIIRALCPENNNICVIGDPDQSIYGFRGSDVSYFNRFIDDYSEAEVIHLKRNYRSTETILEASYHIIKDQHVNISGSRIYSEIDGDRRINILALETERSEAVAIGKIIEEMIGGTGLHYQDFGWAGSSVSPKTNLSFSDFGVLYRTHSQCQVIADAFTKAGIPYQVANRDNAFHRKGITELLSYIKIMENVGSYADFQRIVLFAGTGIGKKTFAFIKQWCFRNKFSLNEAISNLSRFPVKGLNPSRQLKLDGFMTHLSNMVKESRRMNIKDKLLFIKDKIKKINSAIDSDEQAAETFNNLLYMAENHVNIYVFIEQIALQSDTDLFNYNVEKVALMTMHASKGLEFPVVFIAGCEKDYIPYKREEQKYYDINEEKRLLYVAMTRAKDNLYLTYSKKRRIFGTRIKREMSPFINDIEALLKNHESPGLKVRLKSELKKGKKATQIQLELF